MIIFRNSAVQGVSRQALLKSATNVLAFSSVKTLSTMRFNLPPLLMATANASKLDATTLAIAPSTFRRRSAASRHAPPDWSHSLPDCDFCTNALYASLGLMQGVRNAQARMRRLTSAVTGCRGVRPFRLLARIYAVHLFVHYEI